jgi:hypothetical protein
MPDDDPEDVLHDEVAEQSAIDRSTDPSGVRAQARDDARRQADERLGVDQGGPNPS